MYISRYETREQDISEKGCENLCVCEAMELEKSKTKSLKLKESKGTDLLQVEEKARELEDKRVMVTLVLITHHQSQSTQVKLKVLKASSFSEIYFILIKRWLNEV